VAIPLMACFLSSLKHAHALSLSAHWGACRGIFFLKLHSRFPVSPLHISVYFGFTRKFARALQRVKKSTCHFILLYICSCYPSSNYWSRSHSFGARGRSACRRRSSPGNTEMPLCGVQVFPPISEYITTLNSLILRVTPLSEILLVVSSR
jgi:hypothetical protein